jgi:ribosomal protein S20
MFAKFLVILCVIGVAVITTLGSGEIARADSTHCTNPKACDNIEYLDGFAYSASFDRGHWTTHNQNIKPIDNTMLLLQVKTHFNKAIEALLQHNDKQTAILHLKAANSKLTSATRIASSSISGGHSGDKHVGNNNTRSSIQSVKTSTKNAIQALQSNNNMIALQGLLHMKSADSKLSSILSTSSPIVVSITITNS